MTAPDGASSALGGVSSRARPRLRRLERRLRFVLRLLRLDTPVLWRVAAHAVVLVLTLAVFTISRLPTLELAEASTGGGATAELSMARRMRERARVLVPRTVLGTELSALSGATVPSAPSAPGFVSPGLIVEADMTLLPWNEPQRYAVQAGDTISGIAAKFGIEPETLLYANPAMRDDPHSLSIGDLVTILPVNGVLHIVEEGDSIESLAERYKATVLSILGYAPNGLSAGGPLAAGTEIVVPGGEMEIEIPNFVPTYTGPVYARTAHWGPDPRSGGDVVGSGSFHIATVGRRSQGFHRWHLAVDIANGYGTPIYAVDSGTVEAAGWLGALGNGVTIDHGNGYESLYAHMQSVHVSLGQSVQRGQIIGGIGCSRGQGGRCTGPHLHIEVFYQRRPVDPCGLGVCP